MKAMRDELARSMEKLQLEGLERPYFIAYSVQDRTEVRASASFGAMLGSSERRSRYLSVELRVGDYALDNTNFLSLQFGRVGVVSMSAGAIALPLEDDYKELRRQIWLATDAAYKKALEDLSKKRAVLQTRIRLDDIADFSREESATIREDAASAQIDLAQAEALLRELSALFKGMPEVFASTLNISATTTRTRYVNSEGTSFTRTAPLVSFVALAATQAPDGMPLEDFIALYGRSMDQLPKGDELAGRIRELGMRLARLRAAPLLEQYNGPVLFAGEAAAELFAQIFAPNLLATRRPITDNPQFERLSSQLQNPFLDKLGARVLPDFISIIDNPTLDGHGKTQLVGGYRVDDDGVPARETKLVEKGVLKTLLATRNPVPGVTRSTGNRRGAGPAPSNLVMVSEMGLGDEEMKKELLKLVAQRGKEYGVIVRRIANPMFRLSRDRIAQSFFQPDREGGRAESVILAYKLFPDGREELVRNAELSGISAATFKEIVAASSNQTVYSVPFIALEAALPLGAGVRAAVPNIVSFVVPSLLFEDITLKKPSGEMPKPPVAKHPFFDR